MKVLALRMNGDTVDEYLSVMQGQFSSPLINEHFGDTQEDKETHQVDAI